MSSQGQINALGEQYIGAETPNVNSSSEPGVVHGGSGTSGGGRSNDADFKVDIPWPLLLFAYGVVSLFA